MPRVDPEWARFMDLATETADLHKGLQHLIRTNPGLPAEARDFLPQLEKISKFLLGQAEDRAEKGGKVVSMPRPKGPDGDEPLAG